MAIKVYTAKHLLNYSVIVMEIILHSGLYSANDWELVNNLEVKMKIPQIYTHFSFCELCLHNVLIHTDITR